MEKRNVVSLEDRIPKLKQQRQKKANRRLITLLSFFFLMIVLVVYFQSPLSRIGSIQYEGNSSYDDYELSNIAALQKDNNIWTLDRTQVEKKLKELPEIKSAQVNWLFPNRINIKIVEYNRIAYIVKDKQFVPVMENGSILDSKPEARITASLPLLKDFKEGQALDEMVSSLQKLPNEVTTSISEIQYTPKDKDKFHINLYMNDGNEVSASLRSFTEKMVHYPSIISQLDPSQKGIIDLEVGTYFQSYDLEGNDQPSEEEGEG